MILLFKYKALKIPDNIVLTAACNPYKLKVKTGLSSEFEAHPEKKAGLIHQVLPIPSRMLQHLYDFGDIKEVYEKLFINQMLNELGITEELKEAFAKSIFDCQNYIREKVEKNHSTVSLRDIQRVKELAKFFYSFVKYKSEYTEGRKFDNFVIELELELFSENEEHITILAFALSLYFCYVCRVFSKGNSISLNRYF